MLGICAAAGAQSRVAMPAPARMARFNVIWLVMVLSLPAKSPLHRGGSDSECRIRQDLTMRLFTEGIIQDPATGNTMFNLMQQDMVALRVTMRLGYQVPNPIACANEDDATRYPFSVLTE